MTTVTVSTQIDAPVDEVFKHFTDLDHASQHVTGIKGIEMITPGEFGPGTRWYEIREVLGRVDRAEMRVTSFERNRGYTITHEKGGAKIDTSFAFEPSDGGTKVTIEFTLEALPMGLLSPLGWAISGKVRDVIGQDLADLKETAERARPQGPQ